MRVHLGDDDALIPPPDDVSKVAHVSSFEEYQAMYEESIKDPVGFWSKMAEGLHFETPFNRENFFSHNFDHRKGQISVKWMEGARTNVCFNCVDRWVEAGRGDEVAFFWEGNDPEDCRTITFSQLKEDVCKFANVLRKHGVKKGDRVAIYLPMVPQLATAMLACARIGAVHSIVFGGFSAESLAARIVDAKASLLVTADGVWRGVKLIKLKDIADAAVDLAKKDGQEVRKVIVVRHLSPAPNGAVSASEEKPGCRPCASLNASFNLPLDSWWDDEMSAAPSECPVEWLEAEEPLFMLYTSGSTGKPKGVLHTQAGYLLYAYTTFKYVFDYHPGEVYWCTADIGWITGHSYITYGPLSNGATGVLFEGTPFHPDPGRFWAVVEKYKVSKFYTAPTAIRALMKHGENFVRKHDRSTLRVLGTVGEPINPEAWKWYHEVVGEGRCAIVDTYWQTETGGHIMTPLPGATPAKPGSATFPFFGIRPVILTDAGDEIEGPGDGHLAVKGPWPGLMRTVYGDHQRFEQTYFHKFPGYYTTGDGCRRDEDGYYWITGRVDDMMNVSGHLLSTAEIESALVTHPSVVEAAVVAAPHDVKGQTPYAFVTLKIGAEMGPELEKELTLVVRKKIGPLAIPETYQLAPGLPKTRSGKIMRRILRQVARGSREFGDKTTIAEPEVIEQLWNSRPQGTQG